MTHVPDPYLLGTDTCPSERSIHSGPTDYLRGNGHVKKLKKLTEKRKKKVKVRATRYEDLGR